MIKTRYLIVPGWSDQAGQCRIVARKHEQPPKSCLDHYRANPSQWGEVGIMNSKGKLVAMDAPAEVIQDFKDCEPLAAGMTFEFDAEQVETTPPARERGG